MSYSPIQIKDENMDRDLVETMGFTSMIYMMQDIDNVNLGNCPI